MFGLSEGQCAKKMCFFYIYQKIFLLSISGAQLSTEYAAIWGALGCAALSISRGGAGASKRSAEPSTFNQMWSHMGKIAGSSARQNERLQKGYKKLQNSYKL